MGRLIRRSLVDRFLLTCECFFERIGGFLVASSDRLSPAIRGGAGVALLAAPLMSISFRLPPAARGILDRERRHAPTPSSATMPKLAMIARGLAASSTVLGSVS